MGMIIRKMRSILMMSTIEGLTSTEKVLPMMKNTMKTWICLVLTMKECDILGNVMFGISAREIIKIAVVMKHFELAGTHYAL